ncbi:hypothetical protein MMC17_000889 [Xylographa soralifera]|nr:hypothetical protein [Xylographa soralifera]
MADPMQNFIHALSQLQSPYSHRTDNVAYTNANREVKEHIELLDGLALLLVFSPNGDVAATGLWRSSNAITLLWCKNEEVTDLDTLHYISSLRSAAFAQKSPKEMLDLVAPFCRMKIFERCKKLAKSFGVTRDNVNSVRTNLWQYNETDHYHQQLRNALVKLGVLITTSSVSTMLDIFIKRAGCLSKDSPLHHFTTTLLTAWALSTGTPLANIITREQTKRVDRLGDYMRILYVLPALVKRLSKDGQIMPPKAQQVPVCSGTLDALNLRCLPTGHDKLVNFDDVRKYYDGATAGSPPSGIKSVKCTQHCEFTLLMDMIGRYKNLQLSGPIVIGISKASCQWCHEFMNLVKASVNPELFVVHRATHGKQPDGWLLPQMRQSIASKIDLVFWTLQQDRERSDSAELSGLLDRSTKDYTGYFAGMHVDFMEW